MKKLLKKVIVVVTAVMMLVGLLPAAAMAETTIDTETATLKVKKTDSVLPNPKPLPGAEFTIYKIATLDTTNSNAQLTYTVGDAYKAVFTAQNVTIDNLNNQSATKLEEVAKALKDVATTGTTGTTVATGSDGFATFTINKADYGLYLVVETKAPQDGVINYVAGNPFFVEVPKTSADGSSWEYDITVTPKNAKTTVTKKIVVTRDDQEVEIDADTVKTDDVIKYVVRGTIPYFSATELEEENGTASVTITDTLSGGLVFNPDALNFKVEVLNASGDVVKDITEKFTTSFNEKKTVLTATTSDKATLSAYNGQDIKVTYSAKVDSVVAGTAGVNKAQIGTEQSSVPVYTFAIEINKSGSDVAALAGVEFELYSDADVADGKVKTGVTPIATGTTGRDGKITFNGLDADATTVENEDIVPTGTVYWLKETKTVDGYTLLAKLVKVEIIPTMENGKATGAMKYRINDGELTDETAALPRTAIANIKNNKGFSLPSTGGMGTYIFTIGGIVIMAAAAVVLVAMKKRNRA